MSLWARPRSGDPETEMVENDFDDLLILDGADDPHGSPAFWTREQVDLIHLLNQPCLANGELSLLGPVYDIFVHVTFVVKPDIPGLVNGPYALIKNKPSIHLCRVEPKFLHRQRCDQRDF